MSFYETLADKKRGQWSFINPLKFTEAAKYYSLAGDNYKLERNYEKAKVAYIKAVDCYNILNDKDNALKMYINIFNIVSSAPDKIYYGNLIIDFYLEKEHFHIVGDYLCVLAKLKPVEEAIETYIKAVEFYEKGKYKDVYQKHKAFIKIAKLYTQLKDYKNAIIYFDKAMIIENVYIEQLILYKILCLILDKDYTKARNEITSSFSYKEFMTKLLESIKQKDITLYTNILNEYEKIIPFTTCMLSLLVDIKQFNF